MIPSLNGGSPAGLTITNTFPVEAGGGAQVVYNFKLIDEHVDKADIEIYVDCRNVVVGNNQLRIERKYGADWVENTTLSQTVTSASAEVKIGPFKVVRDFRLVVQPPGGGAYDLPYEIIVTRLP